MATQRGGGLRTRGGKADRGRAFERSGVYSKYTRSDSNGFKLLADMVSENETFNEDSNSSSESESWSLNTRKRQRRSTSGRSASKPVPQPNSEIDFDGLSTDQKLSTIFSTLTCNQRTITHLEQKMNNVFKVYNRVECMETVMSSYDDRLKLLEYKSIDSEARARRNNLLFKGIKELRNEDCKQIFLTFLENDLGLDREEFPAFERIHRLGARGSSKGPCPIIVAFTYFRDTEFLMSRARNLKDTPYGISPDYPVEITRARQTLWPHFKAAWADNPQGRTSIAYPAKLVVNGRVKLDMFPDWNQIMRGSRVDCPNNESTGNIGKNPTGPRYDNSQPPSHEMMDAQEYQQLGAAFMNYDSHQQQNARDHSATGSWADNPIPPRSNPNSRDPDCEKSPSREVMIHSGKSSNNPGENRKTTVGENCRDTKTYRSELNMSPGAIAESLLVTIAAQRQANPVQSQANPHEEAGSENSNVGQTNPQTPASNPNSAPPGPSDNLGNMNSGNID